MATAEQYAAWIVANQRQKGTPDFEVVAKAYEEAKAIERASTIQQQAPVAPAPTLGQRIAGAAETGLALGTGATSGVLGYLGGTAAGLGRSIASGTFGTQAGVQDVGRSAQAGMRALTYEPRTELGREFTQATGEAIGEIAPPILPILTAPGAVVSGMRQAAPLASRARTMVEPVVQAPMLAAQAAGRATGLFSTPNAPAIPGSRASIGAAGVTPEALRIARAENLPIPFAGESGLTAGQAGRASGMQDQIQFEKEISKTPTGAPIRQRLSNQTMTLLENFDALIDRIDPIAVELRSIGTNVDSAIVNRADALRNRIRNAYTAAEKAGEMESPVVLSPLVTRLNELVSMEGLVPTIPAIRQEAIRLGAIVEDSSGNLIPRPISLRTSEILRQFVNEATDWTDSRQSNYGRSINNRIDQATEGLGGDLYRQARRMRANYAQEFQNTGITARLLGTKGNTDERKIAIEDVFNKIILDSPLEEMNKVRATLLRGGQEGRSAWADLKAQSIQRIKEAATSASQTDEFGVPIVSADKLSKLILGLDREGKLQSLYGKQQAQTLRDLAEVAKDIYTAPPGSVNTSNTASALTMMADAIATNLLIGLPVPAKTAIGEALKYTKNRKTRSRVEAALRGIPTTDN